jgi:hypothetical protein
MWGQASHALVTEPVGIYNAKSPPRQLSKPLLARVVSGAVTLEFAFS